MNNKKNNLIEVSFDSVFSKQKKKFLESSLNIIENESEEIGFVCRYMTSASIPHSKVIGNEYIRNNGNFTLKIVGNEKAGGVPYGVYPRLILSWVVGEVVKNQSREINFGNSLADFMKSLGLGVSGGKWGTVKRFKEQLKQLFSSYIVFSYEDKKTGEFELSNMNISDNVNIFWDPNNPDKLDLFSSNIQLGEQFYNEIIKAPVPVDLRAINALKCSSLALDRYFWLSYRMSYLKTPINLSFEQLQLQFGGGYNTTRQGKYEFKRKFSKQLEKVLILYPEANISFQENGILLKPSRAHIRKKISKIS